MNYGFGKEASRPVDGTCTAEREHGKQLLAQTSEGVEFGMVDLRACADLGVVGDIAVRELAAYDIWVF